MSLVGYSLVAQDGSIVKTWPALPQRLDLPGPVIVYAAALGPQLGLTDEQIDDLFRQAATIEV